MGGGGQQTEAGGGTADCGGSRGGVFTWEEVQKHAHPDDRWLVIERKVYNITKWAQRHPGGRRVISHYAGEDATDAFRAFHPEPNLVRKFLKPLLIGELAPGEPNQDHQKSVSPAQPRPLTADSNESGPFTDATPLLILFVFAIGHVTLIRVVINGFVTVTPGLTHTVLPDSPPTKRGCRSPALPVRPAGRDKGPLGALWNCRTLHRRGDELSPSLPLLHLCLLSLTSPLSLCTVGPPLLIPVYFHIQIIQTMISRRDWVLFELQSLSSPLLPFPALSSPLLVLWNDQRVTPLLRFLESHWFVWVTQMNHIPMDIDYEKHQDWLSMQVQTVLQTAPSSEHTALSPEHTQHCPLNTMNTLPHPLSTLHCALVTSVCIKPSVPVCVFSSLSLPHSSLKKSGDLWLDAYLHK
uniref:Cytochrome b5 heme-binding domain-containing protein n=1 Tax=Lepisosteus oculatus TaxID=7918 RepID=W5MJF6_LEPOC